MDPWLDAEGRLFNPRPVVSTVPLGRGHECLVIDDALAHPRGLIDWACAQRFEPPRGYPYPGLVLAAPADVQQRVGDFFAEHARARLGARRTLECSVRLSLVTTPPAALAPVQWQCHRDRIAEEHSPVMVAACVLYLFDNAAQGGTSFYAPRLPPGDVERMVADSQQLDAIAFAARWGLKAGYMAGSNAHFERTAQVPAAFNRLIVYNGSLFHSADVQPTLFSANPRQGRLTLNGFFSCRRNAA